MLDLIIDKEHLHEFSEFPDPFDPLSTFHYMSIFAESGTFARLVTFICLGTIPHHISTRVIIVQHVDITEC